MAVPGSDAAKVNRVLTTTLDAYINKVIVNDLARNDAIVGMFGANGRIRVQTGGERAIYTIDDVENPNFGWRDKLTDIPTSQNDSRKQAKYAFATLDGMVVISDIEAAMNAGDSKIYDLVEAELTNAKNTIIRQIADALRATTPTNSMPESIVTLIPNTAQASQTTTTGELSRTTTPNWKSQYTATAMTLNTAQGLQDLMGFYLGSCSKGNSKNERPDFGLTTATLFAALSAGHGDALRRYQPNSKMLELGFNNIQVFDATIVFDPSMAAHQLRFINTNYCELVVLRTPSQQNVGERPNSLPISVKPFQDAFNSLKRGSVLYTTMALTTSSLQRQGIANNCS